MDMAGNGTLDDTMDMAGNGILEVATGMQMLRWRVFGMSRAWPW